MPFHNMSWIQYPSYVSTAVEDVIEAQSLLARCIACVHMCMHMVLCILLGLAIRFFNLVISIRGCAMLRGLSSKSPIC